MNGKTLKKTVYHRVRWKIVNSRAIVKAKIVNRILGTKRTKQKEPRGKGLYWILKSFLTEYFFNRLEI